MTFLKNCVIHSWLKKNRACPWLKGDTFHHHHVCYLKQLEDEQEIFIKEKNRLNEEDAKLYRFCQYLANEVSGVKADITNITGSHSGVHHSHYVGIEVVRVKSLSQKHPFVFAELHSPNQCRSV